MCVSNFVLIIFFSEMYGRQEQGEIGFFQTYPKMKKDVIKWYYSAKISKLAKLSPSFTIKHCRVQYYIMFTNIFSLETSLLWLGFFFHFSPKLVFWSVGSRISLSEFSKKIMIAKGTSISWSKNKWLRSLNKD